MTAHEAEWMPPVEWEPGIPLHRNPYVPHQSGLFNLRDERETRRCHCGDAAHWTADPTTPLQNSGRPLPPQDELTKFIAEHRAWVAAGRPEAAA